MDPRIRSALQSLIFAVLYLLLFVILTPVLIKVLDATAGKILYFVLVIGGLLVAFRLRYLSGRLSEKSPPHSAAHTPPHSAIH